MDDVPVVQSQPQPQTQPAVSVDPSDEHKKKRLEATKPDDRNKFAKAIDRKSGSKTADEEDGVLAISSKQDDDDQEDSIFNLARKSARPTVKPKEDEAQPKDELKPKEDAPVQGSPVPKIVSKNEAEPKKDKDSFKHLLSTGQNKVDASGISEDEMALSDTDEDSKDDGSSTFNFGQEARSDLFQFIAAQTLQTTEQATQLNSSSLSRKEAADLAMQIIDKMTVMQSQDEMTTQLTLKDPPLFAGAQVTIKQSSTAQGEFNLSFQNLTNQAKAMIDLHQSRDVLKQSLQEKGYNVHIIVATTEIEKPEYKQDLNQQQDQGRQRDQQGGSSSGGQQQQQRDK